MDPDLPGPPDSFEHLRRFIRQNATIDLRTVVLSDPERTSGLSWSGLESERELISKQLEAYQRLARLVPASHEDVVFALLREGLHSALQVAAMPRQRFVASYLHAFDDDRRLLEGAYQRALEIRAEVLRRYVGLQQQNEPHVKLAKIEPR